MCLQVPHRLPAFQPRQVFLIRLPARAFHIQQVRFQLTHRLPVKVFQPPQVCLEVLHRLSSRTFPKQQLGLQVPHRPSAQAFLIIFLFMFVLTMSIHTDTFFKPFSRVVHKNFCSPCLAGAVSEFLHLMGDGRKKAYSCNLAETSNALNQKIKWSV